MCKQILPPAKPRPLAPFLACSSTEQKKSRFHEGGSRLGGFSCRWSVEPPRRPNQGSTAYAVTASRRARSAMDVEPASSAPQDSELGRRMPRKRRPRSCAMLKLIWSAKACRLCRTARSRSRTMRRSRSWRDAGKTSTVPGSHAASSAKRRRRETSSRRLIASSLHSKMFAWVLWMFLICVLPRHDLCAC